MDYCPRLNAPLNPSPALILSPKQLTKITFKMLIAPCSLPSVNYSIFLSLPALSLKKENVDRCLFNTY